MSDTNRLAQLNFTLLGDKYQPNDPNFSAYASRRSVVYGLKGIVAASQPLAVQAGLEILNQGGNAADAAVAVAAALNVTEPSSTGIGGDAFCLFYNASDKLIKGINSSGRSPAKLNLDTLLERNPSIKGERHIPFDNINAVTVPGAAAGWCATVQDFGGGKLGMKEVLAPAIRMAEEGVPVSQFHSHAWHNQEDLIRSASESADAMLLDGKAPLPGDIMTFPDMAKTFREVAEHGKDGFYKGRVAQAIVDLIQSKGGVMELSDLASHEAERITPISYTFDGVTVYECPPNGQGLTALVCLGILDELQNSGRIPPLSQIEHNSVEYLHILIEAMRLAFADTRYYVSDPEKYPVPVGDMLKSSYLRSRADLIDLTKCTKSVYHGSPANSSDTVYFTVADQWGNACSFINSNYALFGTAAIPKGCGFTLQNRGSAFHLIPGHPNMLEGGKRPYHTIIPAMTTRNGELWLSYGVMGAFMQPQGHVQVLLNLLRGMNVQAALDAPRFCVTAGQPFDRKEGDMDSEVFIEEGIDLATVQKLREMGHDARPAYSFSRMTFGRGQVIEQKWDRKTGRRVWAAGSDGRADGHAAACI